MRIHILLMLVSVLFFSNAVKAQNFVWGQKMGSSNFDVGSDIDTDSSGNSVVVGTFYASTTIDAITLTASGSSDGFVAKLDASGDAIWAIAIGGIGQEDVKSVKVDQSTGDIYITGNYSAAFTLGGTVLPYTTWGNDVFLAKLSSTGSVLWAKGFTGTFSDYACDVAIDEANGYVYAFGAFDSNFTIGTTSFNSSNFQTDLYLAKYSTSGSFIWARQFIAGDVYTSGLGTKYGGIGVLSNGDVAIASNFRGYITMDGFSLAATGGSQFSYDVLIARVGSDGTTVWAKNAGGSSTDYGNDLAIDSADNLWLTGRTAGATTFGTINLPASGTSAAFIAKYDSAGVAQYAYQTGGGSINDGNGIDVDALGNVYLIGRYYSAITFGSIILTSSNTGSKLFLAKLNASTSTWEWAIGPDYSGSYSPAEEGKAIAVGDEDDVFLTGIFSGTIKLANQILVTSGSYDIFIAKVGDCSTLSAGINTLGSTTICSGGSVGFYADTSSLYEYQWLFNNASLPGQINYNYSANQGGNYSVVIDSLGCLDTSSVVSVIVGTTPIVTQSALGTYCENAAPFALTGGLPAGGTYSGTGVSSGVFSPSVAGPGTHPITYTYTNSDGCSASASQTISVTASPFVFMLAQPSVCEDDTPFALASGIPGGGTYSGTGVTGGLVFNPAVAGVGTHKVYYTRTTGSCSTTDSVNVVVNGVPNVNMGALADVCITTSFTPLIGGTPGGGTYSGPGVSSPFFFPLAAGAGEHNIVYTVTQSGCSSSDTATIQVDLVPNPIMAPLPDLCENDADLNLNIYAFPSGGVFTGPSVVDSIFSPQVFGAGTDTIVYTIANACGIDTAMRPITVNPSPNISVLAFAPVCVDAGIQSLSGGSPLGGTFSGSGVVGGTFTPQTAGVGTHTITYTYTNASGCADSASNTITVNPLPVVTLSAFADVCIDAGTQTLSGGSPAGGTYFGTAVLSGNFDPTTSGVGTFQIGYAYTDGNTCSDTAYQTITVNPLPTVTLSAFADVCVDAGSQSLAGGSPIGGTYFGTGISAGNFDPATAGVGTFQIGYAYADANSCADTAYQNITVNPLPTVTLSPFSAMCIDAGSFTLTGGAPTGGTYFGTGVSVGIFDPASAGTGIHQIGYTFVDGNSCTDTAYQNITVNPLPVVTLSAFADVCIDAGTQTLSGGSPAGGTYFGTAVLSGNFDPTTSGVGTFQMGYAYTDGNTCSDTAYQTITVNPLPTVTLSAFADVCVDAGSQALSGGSPTGGTYFGTAISAGNFDPATAGVGTFQIGYAYADANSCTDTAYQNMTVNPLPTVTLSVFADVCIDAGSFTLTGGTPTGGTYFGTGVSAGSFDPASAGSGTHQIGYTFVDGNSCTDTAYQNIVVNPLPVVTLSAFADVCIDAGMQTLSGGLPAGGTYFGTAVSSGIFDPTTSGVGTFQIGYAYTDGNTCSDTAYQTITVNPLPTVTLSAFADVCVDAGSQALSGGSPTGGTYFGTAISAGNFDPAAAGVGTFQIGYAYADANSCTDTAYQNITVNPLPTVTLSAFADVCIDAGSFTLTGGAPTGGTYFGTGVSAGSFDPATAGAGTHQIGYTYVDGNSCTDTAYQNIVVNPLPTVTLSAFADVCIDAGTQTLSGGLPAGGTYFGTAVSSGNFDPTTSGVGTFQIGYAYTDGNTCSDTAYQTITVNPLPTVTLSAFADVCVDAGSQALSGGSPTGGTYFGTAISAGNFDPATAGVGTFQIGYAYADANSCTDTAYQNITVNPLPTVTLSVFADVCIDAGSFTLTGGTPTGGTYFGTGVSAGSFDPASAGSGTHQIGYTFVDGNSCTDTAYQNIVVNPLPVVTLSAFADVCIDAGMQTLSGGLPAGGTYFGTAVSSGIFDPTTSGVGTFQIGYAYTDGNTCSDTAYQTITVNPLPTVTLSAFADVCVDAGSQALSGGSPTGGTYFGTAISAGNFDPATSGVGTFQIGYAYADANACADTAYQNITVNPLPTVTLSAFADVCIDAGSFTLTGGAPTGGTYFGTGVSSGIFDPASASAGTHQIGYAYADANSCTDTAYQNITVNPLPTVTLSAFADVCIDAGTQTLSGGLPAGGTYFGTAVSSGNFDPTTSGVGTFQMGYAYTDGNTCSDTAYQNITVNPLPTVTLSAFADVCFDAGSQVLSGGLPTGGTYFGTAVSSGNFDPATAGVGTFQIGYAYADANSCTDTAYQNITVNPLPTVTLSAFADVCIDAGSFTLTGGAPTGGTYFGTGVSAGSFDPASASAGTHQIGYTFVDGNSCADTAYQNITVNPLPTVTFSIMDSICTSFGSLALQTNGSPLGGVFSGLGLVGSQFVPSMVGTGTYTLTYSVTDANGCVGTASDSIYVRPEPVLNVPSIADVCEDLSIFQLPVPSPLGGTFISDGILLGDTFDVQGSGVGSFYVNYYYTDQFGCMNSTGQTFNVNALPIVSFDLPIDSICEYTPVLLTGEAPVGGVFSGPGVSNDTIYTTDLDYNQNVTYTFTDTNGCINSAIDQLWVNPDPGIQFSEEPLQLCAGEEISLDFANPIGGDFYSVFVNNGSLTAPDTAYNGLGGVYAFGNVCGFDQDTFYLNVTTNPVVDLGSDTLICEGNTLLLNAGSQSEYVWSNLSSDSTYLVNGNELVSIGNQLVSVVVYDELGCYTTDSIKIEVAEQPAFYLGDNIYSCLDSTILLNVESTYDSYVWSTGDTGVSTVAHDGSIIMPGLYNFWVAGFNNNGCSYTDSIGIRLADCNDEYVGIDESSLLETELIVYPNPTRGNLFVQWSQFETEPITEIAVYDIFGSLVDQVPMQNVDAGLIELSANGLADGMYLLSVSTAKSSKTVRVLVQK